MTDAPKRRGRPPKEQADVEPNADARLPVQPLAGQEAPVLGGADSFGRPPVSQHDHTRRRDPHKRIGELELGGLKSEAWWAYDMQDEYVRFDTTGRKWTFRPEQSNSHAEMLFELRKGEDVRERRLSMSVYGTETAREQSDKVVSDLDAAL